MATTLYIGNKNYSTWSLRPWLALKWAGIPFEEKLILLGGPGYGRSQIAEVRAVSPSGRLPALEIPGLVIWDSLAICEWAAETAPEAALWPKDALARAACRSVACEMHSGFAAMRRDLSMNIRRRTQPREWPEDTRDDLARVDELWTSTRARWGAGGPFLFGARTIADAFFAPVVARLRTYGVPLGQVARDYSAAMLSDPAFLEWEKAAVAETWTIGETEAK
jgi:glutathione S-transferase